MQIICKTYKASDILKAVEKKPLPGGLPFCRYSFSPKTSQKTDFGGAGLYACFYRKELIYIGKYQGSKASFSTGDIVTMRWAKHLGTFTMQAKNLGFSKKALANILSVATDRQMTDLQIPQEISDGFINANNSILQRETGCMTTFQRFLVAIEVWRNAKNPGTAPELNDFDFTYCRIEGDIQTKQARDIVSSAEDYVLDSVHPRGNSIPNRRQTALPDLLEIQTYFEEALLRTASTKVVKIESHQDTSSANQGPTEEIEPEQIITRFEASIEDAPDFAQQFVKKINAHFIDIEEADIEFTNTPDMRVRKLFPHSGRGFRNCIRFVWQPSKKRFLMHSQLSEEKLKLFGLTLDRTLDANVLPNVTFLDEEKVCELGDSIFEAISHTFSIFEQ